MNSRGASNTNVSNWYLDYRNVSQGVNKDTLMFGRSDTFTEGKVGKAFDKFIYVLRHPITYYNDCKSAREMIRRDTDYNPHEIAKELKDRRINKVPHDFDLKDIQAGLKKVEAKARKDYGLGSDEAGEQLDRVRQVRMFKPSRGEEQAPGKAADILKPRVQRGDGDEQYSKKVGELKEAWDKEQILQQELFNETTERFKEQFPPKDPEITELIKGVQDQQGILNELMEREKLIPWWSTKERTVPDFVLNAEAEPITKEELTEKIEQARWEVKKAREALECTKACKNATSHDRIKYSAELMAEVKILVTEFKEEVKAKDRFGLLWDVSLDYNEAKNVPTFKDLLIESVRLFRESTNNHLLGIERQPEEARTKLYHRYRARQIAGQAMDRMIRMSENRENWNDLVESYLNSKISSVEWKMMSEAKRYAESRGKGFLSDSFMIVPKSYREDYREDYHEDYREVCREDYYGGSENNMILDDDHVTPSADADRLRELAESAYADIPIDQRFPQ